MLKDVLRQKKLQNIHLTGFSPSNVLKILSIYFVKTIGSSQLNGKTFLLTASNCSSGPMSSFVVTTKTEFVKKAMKCYEMTFPMIYCKSMMTILKTMITLLKTMMTLFKTMMTLLKTLMTLLKTMMTLLITKKP